jgi:capsular polysaccharide biosynthesis protein
MKIDLDHVTCVSASKLAPKSLQSLSLPYATDPVAEAVDLVELQDILYLPGVLEPGQSLCLAEERFVPKESILDCWSVDFFKAQRREHANFKARYAGDFDVSRFDGRACILGNLFSRNFGHWTEELLKVVILEHAKVDCVYVTADLPQFAHDFLAFLGIPRERIVSLSRPTLFARAVFTTAISHENISSYPSALFLLREQVALRLGEFDRSSQTRVWLERGTGVRNGGITANKEEVYQCIRKYDFDVVDMGALTVPEQLRLALEARVMAGAHGAQFVHCQFMPVSSTVIECFSPIHVNPSVLQICRTLKHSYRQIVSRSHLIAPYAYQRDCYVDCEHLNLVLESL